MTRGQPWTTCSLAVPVLQGQVTSLAASSDGGTIAYTLMPLSARLDHSVGIITGHTTRQWSIGGLTSTGAGNLSLYDVSVSSDGSMVAFITESQTAGLGAWVLPARSAPGSITVSARQVYQHQLPTDEPGKKVSAPDSALISFDRVMDEQAEQDVFYHDVPHDLADQARSKSRTQSGTPGQSPWPLSAWPDVPARFVLCTGDRFFPPGFMRRVVAGRLAITPDEIASGHCVALSRPKELADMLAGYAAA
jgi:hypothetical protein